MKKLSLMFLLFVFSGCMLFGPGDPSDIRGWITEVDNNWNSGTITIDGRGGTNSVYDYAVVSVDNRTIVTDMTPSFEHEEDLTFADLQVGQYVSGGFSGDVAESYPVQAYAFSITILSN